MGVEALNFSYQISIKEKTLSNSELVRVDIGEKFPYLYLYLLHLIVSGKIKSRCIM